VVARKVGGRRGLAPNQNHGWSLWNFPVASGGLDLAPVTTDLNQRVASLLSAALCADDAEASGFDARTLVADPTRAVEMLGGPGASPAARHAVVQRFGGVGALLVIACEDCWKRLHEAESDVPDPLQVDLERLLSLFTELGAEELVRLVRSIESTARDSSPENHDAVFRADAEARRWLHVTYAVAARDGTEEAHRAYVSALDRVLTLKRNLTFA